MILLIWVTETSTVPSNDQPTGRHARGASKNEKRDPGAHQQPRRDAFRESFAVPKAAPEIFRTAVLMILPI